MAQLLLPPPVSFTQPEITDKARYLCTQLAIGMQKRDEAVFEYDPESRVEPIETEWRDGFIPWTSGGFAVCLPASLSHHWGTGCAPAPIQPIIDSGSKIIADEWQRQDKELPPLLECVMGEHGAELEEQAQEYESESWANDPDFYFWKARVMFLSPDDRSNETGEAEVYVDAYLNTDLNYGRDHISWLRCYGSNPNQTIGEFKRTIPLRIFAGLTEAELDAIVTQALELLP